MAKIIIVGRVSIFKKSGRVDKTSKNAKSRLKTISNVVKASRLPRASDCVVVFENGSNIAHTIPTIKTKAQIMAITF